MHPLLPNDGHDFEEESLAGVRARYRGFGAALLLRLEAESPQRLSQIHFYRSPTFQTDDVFAICSDASDTRHVALQLDPECEVICLWNGDPQRSIEITSYSPDPVGEALATLAELGG